MIRFPSTMRALNLARYSDGQWQASLQTDAHAPNAFSVHVADTVEAAIAGAVMPHLEIPREIAPPTFGL